MDERPIADPELEAYAAAHSSPEPPWLAAAAEATREASSRHGMMVGHLVGRFLATLVAVARPQLVLEFGTFTGYSAMSMAETLPPGGRIISLELDPEHAALAQRHIDGSPFADRIEIRVGRALDSVRAIPGPVELAFIDADKPSYVDYYEAAMARLAPGGLIVADNVLWNGLVLDAAAADGSTRALQRFNEHVRADPRAESVMLTLRDGMTLIRRR